MVKLYEEGAYLVNGTTLVKESESAKVEALTGKKAVKEEALKEGMHTLRMSATDYVLDGTTSFSEMVKVSFDV